MWSAFQLQPTVIVDENRDTQFNTKGTIKDSDFLASAIGPSASPLATRASLISFSSMYSTSNCKGDPTRISMGTGVVTVSVARLYQQSRFSTMGDKQIRAYLGKMTKLSLSRTDPVELAAIRFARYFLYFTRSLLNAVACIAFVGISRYLIIWSQW